MERAEPKSYDDTWILPEDELAARRPERILLEDQPDTFVKLRAIPDEDADEIRHAPSS
jgi:hypothetical protein